MKLPSFNLLIVEDQEYIRNNIKAEAVKTKVFDSIFLCSTVKEAREIIANEEIQIISLDLSLPDGSGLEILAYLKENNIDKKVIVFSASPEMESVSKRYGAYEFFDKKNGIEPLINGLKNYIQV